MTVTRSLAAHDPHDSMQRRANDFLELADATEYAVKPDVGRTRRGVDDLQPRVGPPRNQNSSDGSGSRRSRPSARAWF